MALDQGTTSSRCIIFDRAGAMRSVAQKEFRQHYPKPGWVEHDANEIWSTQLGVAVEAMQKIANGQATKIIIPSEIQNLAGLVSSLTEVAKTDMEPTADSADVGRTEV